VSLKAVSSWGIWRIPRVAVFLVLAVDISALAIPLIRPGTVGNREVIAAALLASLSIAYSAIVCTWELVRRSLWQTGQPGHYRNFLAVWCFPAAVTLPPVLAAAVIVASCSAEWPARRLCGQKTLYRYVYSVAAAILAALLSGAVAAAVDLPRPVSEIAGGATYVAVGMLPVMLAQAAVGQRHNFGRYLRWDAYRIEVPTVAIGVVVAVLMSADLQSWIWLSLPAAILLQRWAVRADLRGFTEPNQRPMGEQAWLLAAREVIRFCPVGAIMRIETTDRRAANQLARAKAGCDAIGLAGKSGLAVLFPQCPGVNADAIAERMRAIFRVEGVDAQIAVAAKPRDGQSLDDLLAVSEAELVARVAATRPARSERPDA
jgi:diguanylate cyclase